VREAFQEFRDAHGHWPESHAIQEALRIDDVPHPSPDAPEVHWDEWNVKCAEIEVCRASLRISAARLLGQKLQEDHGLNDLRAAIDGLERAREKRNARYAAQFNSASAVPRTPARAISTSKAKRKKHVMRYPDGTPVVVGHRKKKTPGDDPGDIQL
jgi:hypothetical protein